MAHFRMLVVVAALMLWAGPCLAQTCLTKGSPTAEALLWVEPVPGSQFARGLAAATQPATLEQLAAGSACRRESLPGWAMTGENTDPFPRVVLLGPGTPGGGATAFLAALPHPDRTRTVFALVRVWGSGAVRVSAIYDAIPEDRALIQAIRAQTGGGYEPLGFDEATGTLIDTQNYLRATLKAGERAFDQARGALAGK